LKKLLESLSPDYDRIVVDCPPGLGGFRTRFSAPPICWWCRCCPRPGDAHAGAGADHLAAERGGKAPAILPVLSMVDRRKAMHREMVEAHPDWPAIPTPA
jgi:hypothetical protein